MAKPQRETGHQAVLEAGYSPKNPDQSAYQAMKHIAERLREVMDRLGLTDEHAYQTMKALNDRARDVLDAKGFTLDRIIDFFLLPLLEAKETKFFPWRKTTKRKIEQIIDSREVAALAIGSARSMLPSDSAAITRRRSSTSIRIKASRSR